MRPHFPNPDFDVPLIIEKVIMDIALPKIAQLVADARIELKLLGIDTEGKRSDELLEHGARTDETPTPLPTPPPPSSKDTKWKDLRLDQRNVTEVGRASTIYFRNPC